MTRPSPRERIRGYDALPPAEAVAAAWANAGPHPDYHRRMQEQVRARMPMLGRALDRLAREKRGR